MVEQVLLALKALFLLLLYFFVWRVIRAASRDLRVPEESFVLAPAQARRAAGPEAPLPPARLVVTRSPSLAPGTQFETGPVPLTVGRSSENAVALVKDEFASARHARVEASEAERLDLARAHAALVVNGTKHELAKRRVVLGRARDCDISLSDANVSRRHAEIRREDGSYWIVDLRSTNGVEVNGKRVDRARLEHEDRIVLGKTNMSFELPY